MSSKKSISRSNNLVKLLGVILSIIGLALSFVAIRSFISLRDTSIELSARITEREAEILRINSEFENLKNEDQYVVNQELAANVKNIEDTYNTSVSVYEELIKLKEKSDDVEELEKLYTQSVVLLSDKNYASASSILKDLSLKINAEEEKLAAASTVEIPASVPSSNTPPGSGYSRQSVATDVGNFLVSIVAADLGITRVIVDTASDSDCGNECPVLSLGEYVSRNGAYAGVNGSYFCPATYPSCAGKTNSFDLLVMNHKKTYFNSSNNVYSNNPAVIFGDGYIRFVSAASQWGRDTSPSGVLSNYPLLVLNGNITFGGDDDPKKGSRAGRSFVANKGSVAYIGVVHNATVVEAAHALKNLGMENAMNLDSGGSTALWSGGYKAGPGRNIPNAILFVKK